jgi:tetratricopeptide (TPR) repeat protein
MKRQAALPGYRAMLILTGGLVSLMLLALVISAPADAAPTGILQDLGIKDQARAKALKELNAGFAALRLGDRQTALNHFNRSIKSGKLTEDELATALSLRGRTHRRLRYFKEAIDDYTEAIDIMAPKRDRDQLATLYADRGLVNFHCGQYAKALADYDQALKLSPNLFQVYYRRGNVFRAEGKFDEAIADYTRAIAVNPLHYYYYSRSLAYERKGELKKAIADIQTAMRLKPNRRKYRARLYHLQTKMKK